MTMNRNSIDIIASMHLAQGRKPVPEVITAQAEILQKGCKEHKLTWDRVRMTMEMMVVNDEKLTVGSLIQKSRTSPSQDWLDGHDDLRLTDDGDRYFERPIYEPKGYFSPCSPEDRERLGRLYSRPAIRPTDDAEVSPSLQKVFDRIAARAAA
jgi:hypothetical protein